MAVRVIAAVSRILVSGRMEDTVQVAAGSGSQLSGIRETVYSWVAINAICNFRQAHVAGRPMWPYALVRH